ncbi:MAG: hypothetical protein IIB28_02635 [Chloroflexi bacterium]|nr:hypothetical protein [Chloroflexota bacterium]
MLFLRFRHLVASALLFLAIATIACGTDSGAAPGSDGVPLTERQALKKAIDASQNGIYTQMLGTPVAAWGDTMTYGEAAELMAQSISPDSGEYERRNDQVWYIVLEGELSNTTPGAPGGSGPTNERGRGFMALRFDVDGRVGGSSSSLIKTDFGQDGLRVIEIPDDLVSIIVPTVPPAPAVTAAPPATPAPLAPLITPAGPARPAPLPEERTATAEAEALLPPTPTATPLPSPIEDTTNLLFDDRVFHVLIGTVAEFLGEAEIPIIGRDSSFINEWWRIETEKYLMGLFPQADFTVQVEKWQVMEDGTVLPLRFPFSVPEGERVLVFLTVGQQASRPPLSSHVFAIPQTGYPDGGPNAAIMLIRDGRLTVRQAGEPLEVELADFLEQFNEVAAIADRHTGPYPPIASPTPTPTPAPTPVGGIFTAETLGPAIERLTDDLKLVISEDVVIVFNDGDRARNLFFNFNGPATAFHLPTASYSDLRLEEPPSLYFEGTRRYFTPEAAEAINQAIYGSDVVIEAVRAFVAAQ